MQDIVTVPSINGIIAAASMNDVDGISSNEVFVLITTLSGHGNLMHIGITDNPVIEGKSIILELVIKEIVGDADLIGITVSLDDQVVAFAREYGIGGYGSLKA